MKLVDRPDFMLEGAWQKSTSNRFAPAPLRSAALRRFRLGVALEKGFENSVAMSMDSELQKHYALLLGVGSPWGGQNRGLELAEKKVEIELVHMVLRNARGPNLFEQILQSLRHRRTIVSRQETGPGDV